MNFIYQCVVDCRKMKVFAFVVLALVAAVQSRSAGVNSGKSSLAEAGQNPSLVHLRIAVSTSGLLETCAGSLIDSRWVLTSASCVRNARFIWIRYGAVEVISPELVTETSAVRLNPNFNVNTGANDIALVSINRNVEATANIAPASIAEADSDIPASANFCAYGEQDGAPGERLSCIDLDLTAEEDGSISAVSEDGQASRFDLGAPLIVDGVQYGLLTSAGGDNSGTFLNVANYRSWIESEIGVSLAHEEAPEAVNFVN